MDQPTIFQLISELSTKRGIRCVLVGGFAVNYYKVSRQTGDVDFLTTREDFGKISDDLKRAGYAMDCIEETFARLSEKNGYLMDLDFLFVDKGTMDKVLAGGVEMSIGKNKFIVPSLETLIALKLHAIKNSQKRRVYKDMLDILSLICVNKMDYKSKEFRQLCLKFGTEQLYKEIVEKL